MYIRLALVLCLFNGNNTQKHVLIGNGTRMFALVDSMIIMIIIFHAVFLTQSTIDRLQRKTRSPELYLHSAC